MKKLTILLFFIISISSCQLNNERDYQTLVNMKIGLTELHNVIKESCYLTRSWVFIDKRSNTPDKLRFLAIKDEFHNLADTLTKLSEFRNGKFKQLIIPILTESQELINYEFQLTQKLKKFDDYDNMLIIFEVIPQVEYEGEIYQKRNSILEKISSTLMLVNMDINQYTRKKNL